MKILICIIAILMITSAEAAEYRFNIGFFTEHYIGRGDDLNEKNKLIQVSIASDGNVLTGASFDNSYATPSYLIGLGREASLTKELRVGAYVAAVKGYEGHITTHYRGILFAPVVKLDAYGFTANVMPAVYVLGYEFSF